MQFFELAGERFIAIVCFRHGGVAAGITIKPYKVAQGFAQGRTTPPYLHDISRYRVGTVGVFDRPPPWQTPPPHAEAVRIRVRGDGVGGWVG